MSRIRIVHVNERLGRMVRQPTGGNAGVVVASSEGADCRGLMTTSMWCTSGLSLNRNTPFLSFVLRTQRLEVTNYEFEDTKQKFQDI